MHSQKAPAAGGKHACSLQNVVIFLACHALQLDGTVYIVPAGAEFDSDSKEYFKESVEDSCYTLKHLADRVTDCVDLARALPAAQNANGGKPVTVMFILDACRDGVSLDNADDESYGRQVAKYAPCSLNAKTDTEGRFSRRNNCQHILMFSTWKGDTASDGRLCDGHSPYTKALLDHMFIPGK